MPSSIGQEFWRKTFIDELDSIPQQNGKPAPPYEYPYDASRAPVTLPPPEKLSIKKINLYDLLNNRRTVRTYSREPLSLSELSFLLWSTQGIQITAEGERTFRTVPSAGARHAFETLLLCNNIEGIEPGVYRYAASQHTLVSLPFNDNQIDTLIDGFRNIILPTTSAATFMWIGFPERMTWKFGERGYRYLLMDAGHLCQNLYLAAESIGCGTCAIGAFDDEELNTCLGLTGTGHFLVYAASVGKRS
jgi:SagB-type dehydrogenase family enzyme